jgi:glycosyltransferase involved in cell wall biosynthesis
MRRMRESVLGVIDNFGSGGAQRQFVELMLGLAERGHPVEVVVYHPGFDFFRGRLDAAGIPIHELDRPAEGIRRTIAGYRRVLRQLRPEVVISFLHEPNMLAEIGRVGLGVPRLLVSERSSRHGDGGFARRWGMRALHSLADVVVANSHDHAAWLRERFPWLRGRVRCVYNGVNAGLHEIPPPAAPGEELRLLAIGRIDAGKNPLVLARACALFAEKHGRSPRVSWVGRVSEAGGERVRAEVDAFLDGEPRVAGAWTWAGESSEVLAHLTAAHALVHPSLYEGLPNAVCEALAAARPVVASTVGDANRLVGGDGERGYLFAPDDAHRLLHGIEQLCATHGDEWREMTLRCRQFARQELSGERMVSGYQALIGS